jgi:hypothetical protein
MESIKNLISKPLFWFIAIAVILGIAYYFYTKENKPQDNNSGAIPIPSTDKPLGGQIVGEIPINNVPVVGGAPAKTNVATVPVNSNGIALGSPMTSTPIKQSGGYPTPSF